MRREGRPRPRARWRAVALGLTIVILMAGCGDETNDGQSGAAGGSEQPADGSTGGSSGDASGDQPADGSTQGGDSAQDAGGTAGSATDGSTDAGSADGVDQGLSDEDWVLLAILGVVVIAIIVGTTSWASNRSQSKRAARGALSRRLGNIIGACRWVHDRGSVDVLRVTDPEQLRWTWASVRERMIDAEGQIAALGAQSGNHQLDSQLAYLGDCVSALRTGLQWSVSLRLDPDAQNHPEQIMNASGTVAERRNQLAAAIAPVDAARR